jgi:hypothetical protein
MSLAIACASGGYRVAFIQGVLNSLERARIRADVYAGTSGSVIPAALAAIGQHDQYGLAYIKGLLAHKSLGKGMSGVFLESIRFWEPLVCQQLWQPGRPRLVVPVSAVLTPEAAEQTQGETRISRRLGRKLLLASARHDRDWIDANLGLELFDSHAINPRLCLTSGNFSAVAYASSRMLYAWDVPAWIENRPYIDASYTCSCPALELAALGYEEVIAISPEYGLVFHDLFGTQEIPAVWHGTPIHIIQADFDLQEQGVDCTQATEAGLLNTYRHGEEKGRTFLAEWRQPIRRLAH